MALVAEDFVDDGDNVGDVDDAVVVDVALLGGECDDHLGSLWNLGAQFVVLHVGCDVEVVEQDLCKSAPFGWREEEGVCVVG